MKGKPVAPRRTQGSAPAVRPSPRRPTASPEPACSIVGIGASAGGLEALEGLLAHVPAGSGLAWVIVQHLDPTHRGMMPELLQRATGMKVAQIRDGTRVQPDFVYVIPPNRDLSILRGVLHLSLPMAPRGQRLPIDFFLRSLAQDQQERSIGVILSGMGTDGTLGLRAIKEKAGLALVQEPSTAKFDGMPRSVIDAGLADIVAAVDELPARILAHRQRTPLFPPGEVAVTEAATSALEKVILVLRDQTGHDFSHYKRNTLYRRIERRMGLQQIDKLATYVRYLQENPQECGWLFKELLIGVTRFFRDPADWDQLCGPALKTLLANQSPGHALRAWVPGCSTGEEAYSLAIVFKEAVERATSKSNFALQIFATDLNRESIDQARQGFFKRNLSAEVSPERLQRFFNKEDGGYRVRREIREMVIFAPQNLVMDPPFTKLDLLSCRNLLIYLSAEVQRKLIPLFHHCLRPGGLLLLGSAETTGGRTDLFIPLHAKTRIYRRTGALQRPEAIEFPPSFNGLPPNGSAIRAVLKPSVNLQTLAEQLILRTQAPPAILTNDKGDIFYICGRTGKYLEPAAGKANWNLFAMAREGLRFELSRGFQKVLRQKERVILHGLRLGSTEAEPGVNVTLQQLQEPGPLHGLVLIVFTPTPLAAGLPVAASGPKSRVGKASLAHLERELRLAQSEGQATQEAMQASQEELRSANEELQSTNEEMTTSKEELQSLNEELQTVNAELQSKVDQLSRAGDDMKNLLDSTDIATVFLDNELKVRRYTPQATSIIKLIPTDEGRPITDLASELRYPELAADARQVLRTLVSVEKSINAHDGRWFTVRIMPYRTVDDRIDGVVITFADITVAKILEAKLRGQHAELTKQLPPTTAPQRGRNPKTR